MIYEVDLAIADKLDFSNHSELLGQLEDKQNTAMIPAVVMLVIFAVVGLVGNILVLVVYSRKVQLNPTKVLIMTIASFDLVANVVAIPTDIYISMNAWTLSQLEVCKLAVCSGSFTTLGGVFSLLVVAVVRYRKVCKPFSWQVTIRNAMYASLIVAFLAVICSIPYPIMYGIGARDTPYPNIKGHECAPNDQFAQTIWPFMNIILFLFIFIVVVITLFILYVRIAATAWKHREYHVSTQTSSKDKSKPNSKCKIRLSAEDTTRKDTLPQKQQAGFIEEFEQTPQLRDTEKMSVPTCCSQRRRSVESLQNSRWPVILKVYSPAQRSDNRDTSSKVATSGKIISETSTGTEVTSSGVTSSVVTSIEVTSSEVTIIEVTSSDVTSSDVTSSYVTGTEAKTLNATSTDLRNSDATWLGEPELEITSECASRFDGTIPKQSRLDGTIPKQSKLDGTIPQPSRLDEINYRTSRLNDISLDASQIKVTTPEDTYLEEVHSEETTHFQAPVSEDKITATPTEQKQASHLHNSMCNHHIHQPESIRLSFIHENKQGVPETGNAMTKHTRELHSKKMDANHESCIENDSDEDKTKNLGAGNSTNKKDSKIKESLPRKQRETGKKKIPHRRIGKKTFILIAISLIFLLSYLPFLLLNIYRKEFPEKYVSLDGVSLVFYHLFYKLVFLNSAANPIVYSLCDIKFRLKCIELLTCKYTREKNTNK